MNFGAQVTLLTTRSVTGIFKQVSISYQCVMQPGMELKLITSISASAAQAQARFDHQIILDSVVSSIWSDIPQQHR